MEFHNAVGKHETQAGRQLCSVELLPYLVRDSQLVQLHLKASLSYTCYQWVERNGSYMRKEGIRLGAGVLCPRVELDNDEVGCRFDNLVFSPRAVAGAGTWEALTSVRSEFGCHSTSVSNSTGTR